MRDAIVWLDGAAPRAGVGGKGASLLRLTAAGLPVPAGFVLTADAYRRWAVSSGLTPMIDELLATPDLRLPKVAREASAALLAAAASAALPAEVEHALLDAYGTLRERQDPRRDVAVRSSAFSEDGAQSSSAGLYESVLHVRDESALLAAVLTCYRSLWAARAVQYRAFKGIDSRNEAMAVVVMEMAPAEVAGVAFTMNPISGSTEEIVINASWGLGEAIVSGRVTPDSYIVRKRDRSVLSREIFPKEMTIAPDPSGASGTVALAVPIARREAATLNDEQLSRLAELCLAVERAYGGPQDIEWALCGDSFALLQSRPVTGMR